MGTNETHSLLEELEKEQPGKWYSVADIKERLVKKGFSNGTIQKTNNNLLRLASFGMAEMKGEGLVHHIKLFRLHKSKG